jgi:hypothetical protein
VAGQEFQARDFPRISSARPVGREIAFLLRSTSEGIRVSPSTQRVAEEIARYCAAHPEACDSVEGIAWWLARQRYDESLTVVRAAVDVLVADGRLVPHHLSDGSTVFRCRGAAPEQTTFT